MASCPRHRSAWLLTFLLAFGSLLAAGCLGDLPPESASAGLSLAPAYALRIDSKITVQHTPPGRPAETPIEITAAVRGILTTAAEATAAVESPGPVNASFRLCKLDLPPVSGRQLVFRDDVWSRFPQDPVTLAPGSAPGSWRISPWAILMGLRDMADPANDPLPTDPADPRVDPVEDNKPGVRISIQVRAYPDPQIDASVRVRVPSGEVALTDDGQLVGQVELAHDVWVWYADMPWPISDRNADQANAYMREKMQEWPIRSAVHDLSGLPLTAPTDCAQAMALTER